MNTKKPDDRLERIRVVLGWIVAAAGTLALIMSWGALTDLAIAAGIPTVRAWLFPLIIDLPVVASMLIGILVNPTTRTGEALPWVVFAIFTAATIAGNTERVRAIPADQLQVEPWVAALVHAAPPVAVLLLTHLAVVTVYRPGKPKRTAQSARPAEPRSEVAAGVVHLPRPTVQLDRDAARAEVLGLDAEGLSRQAIADRTGVPKSTVNRWIADAKNDERRTA
jgi:hypothetical protein